jgi:uncharacterized lipoprotein YbaY
MQVAVSSSPHVSSAYARLGRESREAKRERVAAKRFVGKVAVSTANALPRLVKVEPQLQVISLQDFLQTAPVIDLVEVTVLPTQLGHRKVKQSLDALLVGLIREDF